MTLIDGLIGAAVRQTALECPMHGELLLEQHLPVHVLDGLCRFVLCLVLNEGVALHEPCPPVKVQVQVLDVSELCEGFEDVVLLGLLVHPGDDDDPPLDGARWPGVAVIERQALEFAGFAGVAVVLLPAA
eukprot:CAMPEP_0115613664 /NCGR_PEP_ID=MMETSP0272-20121206/21706_1 /TAXON_ID=71861 /ORGANISM="Scrippsiella trochoidea, Strain CCMP3099" /LENGTH=129 /DNA_ID=CAMNT_0003049517 /DNA_START=341 /DNA_END=727 /DNA_ORIENTATION=+